MPLELECVVAKIESVQPIKEGRKDDAPLLVVMKFELDLQASDVLPQFHPTLNHFLFDDNGVRFQKLGSFAYNEPHANMQIEIHDLVLQARKISKYHISPYCTPFDSDPEIRNRIWLSCEARIDIGKVVPCPVNLLCEMINTEIEMNIRPSQLEIPEIADERKQEQRDPRLSTTEQKFIDGMVDDAMAGVVTLKPKKPKKQTPQ